MCVRNRSINRIFGHKTMNMKWTNLSMQWTNSEYNVCDRFLSSLVGKRFVKLKKKIRGIAKSQRNRKYQTRYDRYNCVCLWTKCNLTLSTTLTWYLSQCRQNLQYEVRPAKTQISLRICAVSSESSLIAYAFYSLRAIQRGINKKPYYTGLMVRLSWVFSGHTGLIVGFVVRSFYFRIIIQSALFIQTLDWTTKFVIMTI